MIRLDVVEAVPQTFAVKADEPVTVSVMVVEGRVLAFVYEGTEIDFEDDPLGAFDGTLEENTSWVFESDPHDENGNRVTPA